MTLISDLLAKRDGEPPSFADFERIYGQTGNGSEAIDETGSTGYGRSNNGGSSVPNFFEISKLLNFEGEENAAYKPPDGWEQGSSGKFNMDAMDKVVSEMAEKFPNEFYTESVDLLTNEMDESEMTSFMNTYGEAIEHW